MKILQSEDEFEGNNSVGSDTDSELEIDSVKEVKDSKKNEKLAPQILSHSNKLYFSIRHNYKKILLLLVFVLLASSAIIYLKVNDNSGSNDNNHSKSDAVEDIDTVYDHILHGNSTESHHINITDSDIKLLHNVFSIFDINNDANWDVSEFSDYLEYTTKLDSIFSIIDQNSDGILSSREIVVFLKASSQLPSLLNNYVIKFSGFIKEIFNYTLHHTNDTVSDPLHTKHLDTWFEYAAAIFLYFYDPLNKGYITFFDFNYEYSFRVLLLIDKNKDHKIDFVEYLNASTSYYGIEYVSNNVLNQEDKYGVNSIELLKNVSKKLSILSIMSQKTHSNISSLVCPNRKIVHDYFHSNDISNDRRRTQWLWKCGKAGLICLFSGGGALLCCKLSAGTWCAPCTVGAVGVCVTQLSSCSDAIYDDVTKSDIYKYPIIDFRYKFEIHFVTPATSWYNWETHKNGEYIDGNGDFADVYIRIENGCESQDTSVKDQTSKTSTVYFYETLYFSNNICDGKWTIIIMDNDNWPNPDDEIFRFSYEANELIFTEDPRHDLYGVHFLFGTA